METEARRAPSRLGRAGTHLSVWHYLVAIALLPCLGVVSLAAVVTTNRVRDAGDAAGIERTMLAIQRLDELRLAVADEVSAVAMSKTLAAIGMNAGQASQLAGITMVSPEDARTATDAAVRAVPADPSVSGPLDTARTALVEARETVAARTGERGAAAREAAWLAIQSYRLVTQHVQEAQGAATEAVVTGRTGSGSRDTLRAADQLRMVADVVMLGGTRSAEYYLTYLAPTEVLPSLRAQLVDTDAAYRLAAGKARARLSPELLAEWRAFMTADTSTRFDGYVTRSIGSASGVTPRMQELFVTARLILAYNQGLSGLLATAAAEGRAAATADREAATRRVRLTVAGTGALLAVTLGVMALLGVRIRRRLTNLAEAAQRLSSGRLEMAPVRGPREIALASEGLNDAVVSLRRVASSAERLAAGDLASAELRRPAPGPLGAAVHASVVLLADSIREQQRLQQELAHQAAHDSLTGLANRAECERRLALAMAAGDRRVGVLFVDLDHFKDINDSHGHSAGDHVLQVAAARMRAEVRDSDTVCRLGGDEFVVLLDPVDSDEVVTRIGGRIVESLGRPVTYDGHDLRVGASIGAAVSTGAPGAEADELLTRADHAVYRAKAAGRNGLAF